MARRKLSATDTRNLQTLLLASVFEPEAIGERIAQARNEAGLTQPELAELIGVSMRALQGYEIGERIPYRHMEKIAQATRKEWAWLLHGDEALRVAEDAPNDRLGALATQVGEIRALLLQVLEARGEPDGQAPPQQAEDS